MKRLILLVTLLAFVGCSDTETILAPDESCHDVYVVAVWRDSPFYPMKIWEYENLTQYTEGKQDTIDWLCAQSDLVDPSEFVMIKAVTLEDCSVYDYFDPNFWTYVEPLDWNCNKEECNAPDELVLQ